MDFINKEVATIEKKRNPIIALIIPIYNAEQDIPKLIPAILHQDLQPDHILVIDSSSNDRSRELLSPFPIDIHIIPQIEFDHGGTRKLATQLIDADIYIFLTQDAYPADTHTFKNLIELLLSQDKIACAYGRQLPKEDASPISAHARLFNYPENNQVKGFADRTIYGIKTCFNSDSFAAYKKQPLLHIGNFPEHLITGEDVYVAAKLLQHGYFIGYAANAVVAHSHNLSLSDEFHRYFSIGVFHGREKWILENFNSATDEGIQFVKSEMRFLIRQKQWLALPRALASTIVKFFAYQLGLHEKKIPYFIKKQLGINKSFWNDRQHSSTTSKVNINEKNNQAEPAALILMSTYNGEKFLAAQIDSIIAQSFKDWTLLIRDDGSSDHTQAIIKKYCELEPRIIQLKDALGNLKVPNSFAVLAQAALRRDEAFIFFCDQDDVWLPHKLAKQIGKLMELQQQYGEGTPLLVHSDLTVVDGHLKMIHPSYLAFEKLTRNTQSPLHTLLINNFVTGCTVGMNKTLLKIVLPIPQSVFMHDWWCALCAATFGKIGFIDEATLLYRQHHHNSVGSKGFYGKLRELKQIKSSLIKRKRNLSICFTQARHLLRRFERIEKKENSHQPCELSELKYYELIENFCNLIHHNHLMRYYVAASLQLKGAGRIRSLMFWLLLGFVG